MLHITYIFMLLFFQIWLFGFLLLGSTSLSTVFYKNQQQQDDSWIHRQNIVSNEYNSQILTQEEMPILTESQQQYSKMQIDACLLWLYTINTQYSLNWPWNITILIIFISELNQILKMCHLCNTEIFILYINHDKFPTLMTCFLRNYWR